MIPPRRQDFPEQPIEKLVNTYRVLGEPYRLQILRRLLLNDTIFGTILPFKYRGCF